MTTNEALQETDDLIGAWLNMIDRAEKAMVTVPDLTLLPDAPRVQLDTEKWCALFFTPAANPHRAEPKAALAIHRATPDTADVIRYEFRSANEHLRVYETSDFALLRIEQSETPMANLSQDKIAGFAQLLLNKPTLPSVAWPFHFAPPLNEGTRFSTDASQDPYMMRAWTSRIDGGLRSGHLYFMCFKKRQSGDGKIIILNSHHWFDGEAWAPYQGSKPR